MNVITTTDQEECKACLDTLGVREVFKPAPPNVTSDLVMQIADNVWVVGTNDRGNYTMRALVGATQAQAWAFLEVLRGPQKFCNPRVESVGANAEKAKGN
jgi:hypothetical protein